MQPISRLFLGLVAAMCLLTACRDNDDPPLQYNSEYLIITSYSPMLLRNSWLLKITPAGSYIDTSVNAFDFSEDTLQLARLGNDQHNRLLPLLDGFPVDSLLAAAPGTLGCPGCADGGVFVFGYKASGGDTPQYWRIDWSNHPAFLQPYIQQLKAKLIEEDLQ